MRKITVLIVMVSSISLCYAQGPPDPSYNRYEAIYPSLTTPVVLDEFSISNHYAQVIKLETAVVKESQVNTELAQAEMPVFTVPQSDLFLKVVTNGYVTKIPDYICKRDNRQKITITLEHNYPASGGISNRC